MKTIRQSFATPAVPTEGLRLTRAQLSTATNPELNGTIRSVEHSREMLFFHLLKDDHEQIIHWLPQTRFLYHGAEVKPGALHGGRRISVQFASDGGQKFAKEIEIVVEPPGAESTGAQRRSLWPWRSAKKAHK